MNEPTVHLQSDPQWEQQVDQARIVAAVRHTLRAEEIPQQSELSLVIIGDAEIARLNAAYRQESGATDVLTFPYEHDGADEEMANYLGDVIIGYEQAARQAEEEGHAVEEELLLLAVHGALHLLGYDDETAEEKERMWARQRAIMEELGLGGVAPAWPL
ncbi:MAG: rRNA maturation RNase YbeY [Ardenticatenaceae bacterium]